MFKVNNKDKQAQFLENKPNSTETDRLSSYGYP